MSWLTVDFERKSLTDEQIRRLVLDFLEGEPKCIWAKGRGEHRIYRNLVERGICHEGERKGAFYLTPLGVKVVKRLLDSSRKTSP